MAVAVAVAVGIKIDVRNGVDRLGEQKRRWGAGSGKRIKRDPCEGLGPLGPGVTLKCFGTVVGGGGGVGHGGGGVGHG